jgi:hypothetical protein
MTGIASFVSDVNTSSPYFAVRQHAARLRIDDLGIEVSSQIVGSVLGLDALVRDTRTDHLREPVMSTASMPAARLDLLAHGGRPRLGPEDADLE